MRIAAVTVLTVLALGAGSEARGYEFEIDARTSGQAYSVRWFRFSEPDRLLNRRRLTQTLGLEVWDLLAPDVDAGRPDAPPLAPFQLYFSTQLRVDHDFGEYEQGDTIYATGPGMSARSTAQGAIPELGADNFGLEVLHAFIGARGIGGIVDAELGRQVIVDNLDWFAFDGLHVRVRLPFHLAVEGQTGFLVRDSSPAGYSNFAPDGTSQSHCQGFLPDIGAFVASPDCPQESQPAPTFGAAIETRGLPDFSARVSYRRTISATADGVYPDTRGEAPGWGVLEEKLSADVRGRVFGGDLVPWASARWNLLLGLIDEAHAGFRVALGWSQSVTVEALYSYPSFDGDSIFNVFSTEPYWDARATWDLWPGHGTVRGYLRGFYRRFAGEDGEPTTGNAAGAGLGVNWKPGRDGSLRVDLSYEDGYGGLRAGGDLSGRWEISKRFGIEGRASVVHFEEDELADLHATTVGIQAGGVWRIGPGIAVHLLGEENSNRFDGSQLRLLAVLDLAFQPEH
jgi:hypothetical protein